MSDREALEIVEAMIEARGGCGREWLALSIVLGMARPEVLRRAKAKVSELEQQLEESTTRRRCTDSEVKSNFPRILVHRSYKGAMKWTV